MRFCEGNHLKHAFRRLCKRRKLHAPYFVRISQIMSTRTFALLVIYVLNLPVVESSDVIAEFVKAVDDVSRDGNCPEFDYEKFGTHF